MIDPFALNIEDGRPVRTKLLARLKNWDETQLQPLEVNVRPDGTLAVIRGKHRTMACRKHIETGTLPKGYLLPCRLHHFATLQEEIDYRTLAEDSQREGKWNKLDSWQDRQIVDSSVRAITDMFATFGATLGPDGKGPLHFRCTSAAEVIYGRDPDLLLSTLNLFRDTGWLGMLQTNSSTILLAFAQLIYRCGGTPAWSIAEATERLKETGFSTVRRYAREVSKLRGTQAEDYFEAMVRAFNDHGAKPGKPKLRPMRDWKN